MPDGKVIWIQALGHAERDAAGQMVRLAGINFDITARKRAEEVLANANQILEVRVAERTRQLEAMVNSAVSAILTIDTRGVIQSINALTSRLFGYTKEELIGQNVRILMPEPFASEHDGCIASYLMTGHNKIIGIGREVVARRADGTTFPVNLAVSEFEDGGKRFFAGIVTDLTERRAAEEALRESERRLAQSQKMEAVGQLTGGVAHDINNVLTVVSGNLELAMSHIDDDKARRSVQQALDAVDMGVSLNRRLLSFARQRKLEPVVLLVNERVAEVAKLLRQTLGEQITLSIELAADLWQTRADPGEIDNALLNLALNARDAMSGNGLLTIETRNVTLDATAATRDSDARPGDYVRFSVTDTGHGMTSEVRRRAVEPFFTTKEPGKGTGMGLSGVYGFAMQSGGFLTIASEVGKGTTVNVFLPRSVVERVDGRPRHATDDVPTGTGELILVVEDNDQVRNVTLDRLESLGYAVMEARSGPDAIEILKGDTSIALVFSDVVMPGGMTGFDIVRWLRGTECSLKVLLASSYNEIQADDAEQAKVRVLAKPYSRAQLGHAIHEVLAGS